MKMQSCSKNSHVCAKVTTLKDRHHVWFRACKGWDWKSLQRMLRKVKKSMNDQSPTHLGPIPPPLWTVFHAELWQEIPQSLQWEVQIQRNSLPPGHKTRGEQPPLAIHHSSMKLTLVHKFMINALKLLKLWSWCSTITKSIIIFLKFSLCVIFNSCISVHLIILTVLLIDTLS